jgi:hypothetical protein
MSYVAASLAEVVPESLWSDGLIDWDTYKSKWRKDMVQEQVAGWTEKDDVSAAYRQARREKERIVRNTPEIMKDLAGVARRYQETKKQTSDQVS